MKKARKIKILQLDWTPDYGSHEKQVFKNVKLTIDQLFQLILKKKVTDSFTVFEPCECGDFKIDNYVFIFYKTNKLGNKDASLNLEVDDRGDFSFILGHIYKLAISKLMKK